MHDMLTGAVTIAAGILIAVLVCLAGYHVVRQIPDITIDLMKYECARSGSTVECNLRDD